MSGRFEDRVVAVTGAGGQIGAEVARHFVAEGASVVAIDMQEERLQGVVNQITNTGGSAIAVGADLARPGGAEHVVQEAESAFGPVYALAAVHGGGVGPVPGRDGTTERIRIGNVSDIQWDRTMDNNLRSVFLLCRALVDGMVERRQGRIVTVASIAMSGQPWMRQRIIPQYSSSKAALAASTRVLALEVADKGVIANCVVPGAITTAEREVESERARPEEMQARRQRIPRGHVGRPSDIAQVILYLCSDAADFIVGQTIHVNGGEWAP